VLLRFLLVLLVVWIALAVIGLVLFLGTAALGAGRRR
jgi:hypothetical protein